MYVKVRINAGAKKESVERVSKDHFNISVKEKAERNMANARVIELVAREFKQRKGGVRIVSGHHSPGKIVWVDEDVESSSR